MWNPGNQNIKLNWKISMCKKIILSQEKIVQKTSRDVTHIKPKNMI